MQGKDKRLDELIAKCVKNDRIAQREIFELYSARMLAICLRYCRNREDAEDVLQEGFIKIFDKIKGFKQESSLETWMSRIFINAALNQYRKGHLKYQHIEFEDSQHDEKDEAVEQSDDLGGDYEVEKVILAIQKLPDIYRVIINMYAIDGLNHKQIAEELGVSEGTSKSRLSRGRLLLKQFLEKERIERE